MRYPKATKEELTAPPAKFRVLAVDTAGRTEAVHLVSDFDSLADAKTTAKQKAGIGTPVFVYNDQALIVRYGSWH
jgi:hypothetical protein